jgi:electron transport complex protein RnfC
MDISLFARGIKVKAPERTGAEERMAAPDRVTLLLRQGGGSACRALVKPGTAVRAGQQVAESTADGAADLHSPIDGTVTAVDELIDTDGTRCPALVIEAGAGEPTEDGGPPAPPEPDPEPLKRSAAELLDRVAAAGLVQGGRDGRSLAAVIREARSPRGFIAATVAPIVKPLEHLAVRFCDVDPHLGSVAAAAESVGGDVTDLELGIAALVKVTDAANVHLVFDSRQSFEVVEKVAEAADWPVHHIDSRRYPMLAEPFVVQLVSGREPPTAFRRFHESGTLVVDVNTVLEVAAAVRDRKPVVDRVVTVLGPRGRRLVRAPIGASFDDVVSAVGDGDDFRKVILGGPLAGVAHHTLDYPVTKTTEGITLVTGDQVVTFENRPCISCGLCAMVCPTRLVPGLLSRYCEFARFDQAEEAHLFSCVECGCCAYVCPAGRSMVQYMIHGKTEITAARRAS